ncbi:MAG TPA: hypothetical protein VGS27_21980 [Candidatus Sulfotelmatobacter sp.]|nr:hypothetical protein [Candidatus Sulfotelmatobacter sp.]
MARPKSQEDALNAYDPSYRLLEESRKTWDHFISDKVVYSFDSLEVALNSEMGIAKDYLKGHLWIELHMTFQFGLVAEGNVHYAVILEVYKTSEASRQRKIHLDTVRGNPHVLVDDAHLVETPQGVASDSFDIPSVVRLKQFNDGRCLCGYTGGLPLESGHIPFLKNRKLSVLGVGAGKFCEAPHKLVQGGAEIVENISSDKRNSVGSVSDLNGNPTPLIFNIILGDKLTRFRFVEGVQFLPQSVKVLFRPSCLQIGIGQTDAASHV